MLPSALLFISGIFTAIQFQTVWLSCSVLAAGIALSFFAKKVFPAAVVTAGLLLGSIHVISAGTPTKLKEKGFVNAELRVTGFPALTPDGNYEVKSGDASIVSKNAFALYRTQKVSIAGPISSFSTNGRTFYRIDAKEIAVTDPGFRPFALVSAIRKWTDDRIQKVNDPDVRSLLYTMILGNTRFLGYGVKESFRMTGVTHLLAISGLNVAIIGLAVRYILKKLFGEKLSFAGSCLVVTLYVVTAGFGASVLRAGIMFILYNAPRSAGRDPDIVDALAVSLFPVLAFDPSLLLDMGFWLSYGALSGILIAGESLRSFFRPAGKFVSEALGTTLAANLTTLPMLAMFFGGFSLISPLTNLIIIPVFNLITCLLFLLFLMILAGPLPFSFLMEFPLKIMWNFSTGTADFFSLIPSSYITVRPRLAVLFLALYLCVTVILGVRPSVAFRRRIRKLERLRHDRTIDSVSMK